MMSGDVISEDRMVSEDVMMSGHVVITGDIVMFADVRLILVEKISPSLLYCPSVL